MKAKRIVTLALAALLVVMSVVSVSAARLTETDQSGKTEVTAQIKGQDPGDVTYIITIPDVVDFGELSIPQDDQDDYDKDVEFKVTATEINNLNPETQHIAVYVKDQNAKPNDDQEFYIANKENSDIKFAYDVYSATGDSVNESTRVNSGNMRTHGYLLKSFTTTGETLDGTLRFHQRQLYGYDIADIAGDYSGYMVFYSTIIGR